MYEWNYIKILSWEKNIKTYKNILLLFKNIKF